jgi:4-diphosphocytidyl-2-C-methyl-D-erythritol kinase
MGKLIKKSPAKINLGLYVLDKRIDEFHNIKTIFYPLLLSDELTFQKSHKVEISSNSDQVNKLESNIIQKAIKLVKERIGKNIALKIFIDKKIPLGAGLGGGSSNAATTLKALNELYHLKLNYETLADIALNIGSDVPYFLNPTPAIGESRGEKVKPISLEINYPILIVNPGIVIPTKWAFDNIIIQKSSKSRLAQLAKGNLEFDKMKRNVKNDFESLVFSKYPIVSEIKKELYNLGAEFALMTGTGSTVFGIFSNLQRAYLAENFFNQKKYFTYLNNPFQLGSIT